MKPVNCEIDYVEICGEPLRAGAACLHVHADSEAVTLRLMQGKDIAVLLTSTEARELARRLIVASRTVR